MEWHVHLMHFVILSSKAYLCSSKQGKGCNMLANHPKTMMMILSLKLSLSTVLGHCAYVWLCTLYL